MSFYTETSSPRLVDKKLIERVIRVKKIVDEQNVTIFKQFRMFLYNVFINNIGSVLIIVSIAILLIYRYYDVKYKKQLYDSNSDSE